MRERDRSRSQIRDLKLIEQNDEGCSLPRIELTDPLEQFLALRSGWRMISGMFIYCYVVVSLEQCATEETLPALRYVAKAEGGRRAAQMVGWAARPWHVRARAVFCYVTRAM